MLTASPVFREPACFSAEDHAVEVIPELKSEAGDYFSQMIDETFAIPSVKRCSAREVNPAEVTYEAKAGFTREALVSHALATGACC
jgi:hypothetical protein